MADLHRIRARLSAARRDAARLLERGQRPLEEPAVPARPARFAQLELEHERTLRENLEKERDELEAALDRTDAERAEAERRVGALERELSASSGGGQPEVEGTWALLEGELANARLELEQACIGRDRARAELEAMGAELRKVQLLLEAERARGELPSEDTGGTRRAERKRAASRSEKRIAELEGELETERELRKDFERALELAQQQQAEDVGRVASADEAGRLVEPDGSNGPGPDQVFAEELPSKPPPQDQVFAEELPSKPPPQAKPQPVRAEPSREPPERPSEVAPDGWGVPLEAFPEEGSEEDRTGEGKSPGGGERRGPRSALRRRGR
jgi:hypothetical protein